MATTILDEWTGYGLAYGEHLDYSKAIVGALHGLDPAKVLSARSSLGSTRRRGSFRHIPRAKRAPKAAQCGVRSWRARSRR